MSSNKTILLPRRLCVAHEAILMPKRIMCCLRGYFDDKEGYVLPIGDILMQRKVMCTHKAMMLPKRAILCLRGYMFAKKGYVSSYKDKGLLVRVCTSVGTFWAYGGLQRWYVFCNF